jgi:trk system potassium uptake protein TrkA
MTSKPTYYVVIVGCGRLGAYLANQLSRDGHSVVTIDIDGSRFQNLSSEYSGFQIEGDATELAVLKQAKTSKADALIAATREDTVNLMIAQVAKKIFSVPKVVARVFDPGRGSLYSELGVETVCPTMIAGNAFLEFLMK